MGNYATRSRLRAGTHFDHAACSYSIAQAHHAFDLGAMVATEEGAFLFEPVTDNMNAAIVAGWSEGMDGTLAIEGVGRAVHAHLKCFVVAAFAALRSCFSDALFVSTSRSSLLGFVAMASTPEFMG